MPEARVGFCIFCDNIRQEVGNKLSLMGLYGAELTFAGPSPGLLPTFAILVHLICDKDDVPALFRMRVVHVDGTELMNHEQPVAANVSRPDSSKIIVHTMVQMNNFLVPRAGDIEVYLEAEEMSLRAGRLAVKFAVPETPISDSSTAQPQHEKQSRAARKPKAKKRAPYRP